jgi:hypothetical protein
MGDFYGANNDEHSELLNCAVRGNIWSLHWLLTTGAASVTDTALRGATALILSAVCGQLPTL